MKTIFILILVVCSACVLGQNATKGDTLKFGKYDTVSIEVQSKFSFPFCSNTFELFADCEEPLASNCCKYYATVYTNQKAAKHGNISCLNGPNLSWNYFPTIEAAAFNFENLPKQLEKSEKILTKKSFTCSILNTEVNACILEILTQYNVNTYELIAYGSYNGYYFSIQYSSLKKINSNEDLPKFVQQIIRL